MYQMVLHPDIHFAMWASPRIPVADAAAAALAVAASAVDCTAVDTAFAAAGFVDLMMMTFGHFVPFDYS